MMTTVARPAGSSSSPSQPKYYVSHQQHGQLLAPNVGHGDSQGGNPTSFSGAGRTAGKLPAQGKILLLGDVKV